MSHHEKKAKNVSEEEECGVLGDATGDKLFNAADVVWAASYLAKLPQQVQEAEDDPKILDRCDVNRDGKVDAADVVYMASALAKIPGFEVSGTVCDIYVKSSSGSIETVDGRPTVYFKITIGNVDLEDLILNSTGEVTPDLQNGVKALFEQVLGFLLKMLNFQATEGLELEGRVQAADSANDAAVTSIDANDVIKSVAEIIAAAIVQVIASVKDANNQPAPEPEPEPQPEPEPEPEPQPEPEPEPQPEPEPESTRAST